MMLERVKNLLIVALFGIIPVTLAAQQKAPTSIDAAFQEFPHKLFSAPLKNLAEGNSSRADCGNVVTLDRKNAYLHIVSSVCGGAAYTSVFTYFMPASRNPLYAYSFRVAPPDNDETLLTAFYEKQGNQWNRVSARVLPRLSYHDFWGKTDVAAPRLMEQTLAGGRVIASRDTACRTPIAGLVVEYELPRHGTTLKARLVARSFDEQSCAQSASSPQQPVYDKQAFAAHRTLLEGFRFREIDLLWNKQTGTFEIGAKR